MLLNVLGYAHSLLATILKEGDCAIDATVGNGHDTLFLAKTVGITGRVYGFDIQKKAIENTRLRLQEAHCMQQVTLIQESHDEIDRLIPRSQSIKGAIFNLGYLPGGDKSIVTTPQTTIGSVGQLLERMASGGLIVLIVYYGHEEGKVEKEQLMPFVTSLDQTRFRVLKYEFINQKNDAPFLLAVEKK